MKLKIRRRYHVKKQRVTAVYAKNKQLMRTYGVRNNTVLAKFRYYVQKARNVANNYNKAHPCYQSYVAKLARYGIIKTDEQDLHQLTVDSFLARTLQYLVHKKFNITISQARQRITSKRIWLNQMPVMRPTRAITPAEEQLLRSEHKSV